jgi:outer membrane protein TolC
MLAVWSVSKAGKVLTIDKVRTLAVENNRQLLSAKKEIDRSRGEIISARAGALPELTLDGRYTRNIKEMALFFEGEKIPIGQKNDFDFSLSLTQPLYVGGKVGAALKIARVYEMYWIEKVRQIETDVIFNAESIFYQALLAESNLEVLEKSLEQLSHNLDVAEKSFDQGIISEYEMLRARVEKLNVEPQLIGAESNLKVSRKRLKSYLGLPLEEELTLAADLSDTADIQLPPLDSLLNLAQNNRPEISQARLQKEGYDKGVRIAKGGWLYPNLYLNSRYQVTASSDNFKLEEREISKSMTVSLLLNIPLFDGARTIGEVRKAKIDYYQAVLAEKQLQDDIRLEVEQAYDNLLLARTALKLQKETIAQAEEGMRIADIRYQSGIGTQLEVLSAQTALLQARSQLAETVYQLRLAGSELKKATGYDEL